jgi:geranylgeranyl diphosphate synthase type II
VGGADDVLMPLACAVEMIHTYSLIHDDLPAMDNDDLRRGKPTSHKVFGEAIAILAGDALLTRAFHVLVETDGRGGPDDHLSRRLRAAGIVGAAAGTSGLIGGQVADLEAEGRDDVTLADLERLHRAKTGALLGACVVGGGVLGGAGDEDLGRLARFGDAIGLALPGRGRHPRRDGGRGEARQDRGQGRGRGEGDVRAAARARPRAGKRRGGCCATRRRRSRRLASAARY